MMQLLNVRQITSISVSISPVQSQISAGFDNVFLIHKALPEVDFNDIDTSIQLFGKKLSFPLIVSGMTGGMKNVEKINKTIAVACQKAGIGMGIGSQRAMIESEAMRGSYEIRRYAPDILLLVISAFHNSCLDGVRVKPAMPKNQ